VCYNIPYLKERVYGMVLYDFYADWCRPCQMMHPIVDQLEQERPDIEIVRVNVDENPETSADFGISSIPTYILVDGGEQTRITGAMPRAKFYESLGI
jgi:thioredoxin 1